MKIIFLLVLSLFSSFSVFSDSRLKQDMYFRLIGDKELRNHPDLNELPVHITLNHEGGLKCKVLNIGSKIDKSNTKGQWYYIITTCGIWVQSGVWVPKHSKFWIFLSDTDVLFDTDF